MYFSVIGVSPSPNQLLDAYVQFSSDASQRAGEITSYEFSFTPKDDLPDNINYRIIFPLDYDLSTMNIDLNNDCYSIEAPTVNQFKVHGSFTCQLHNDHKNWLEFIGNDEAISKGQEFIFRVDNLQNLKRVTVTDNFIYEIYEINTNTTIEMSTTVLGINILYGIITVPKLINFEGSVEIYPRTETRSSKFSL